MNVCSAAIKKTINVNKPFILTCRKVELNALNHATTANTKKNIAQIPVPSIKPKPKTLLFSIQMFEHNYTNTKNKTWHKRQDTLWQILTSITEKPFADCLCWSNAVKFHVYFANCWVILQTFLNVGGCLRAQIVSNFRDQIRKIILQMIHTHWHIVLNEQTGSEIV